MKQKLNHNKPAMSFRLGEKHRDRLEEVALYRDESQVEVMRTMIDVAWKATEKRKAERRKKRAERDAVKMAQTLPA